MSDGRLIIGVSLGFGCKIAGCSPVKATITNLFLDSNSVVEQKIQARARVCLATSLVVKPPIESLMEILFGVTIATDGRVESDSKLTFNFYPKGCNQLIVAEVMKLVIDQTAVLKQEVKAMAEATMPDNERIKFEITIRSDGLIY